MGFNRTMMKQLLFLITFTVLIYLGLSNLSQVIHFLQQVFSVLSPFLIGLCIAFILNAPLRLFETRLFAPLDRYPLWKKIRRPICIVLSVAVVFVLLLFVMLLVIPEISHTARTIAESAPGFIEKIHGILNEWGIVFSTEFLASLNINWETTLQSALKVLQTGIRDFANATGNFVTATVGVTSSIFNGVLNGILGLIFSLYVLGQKEKLTNQLKNLLYAYLPDRIAKRIISIGSLSNTTFSNFINGQFLEALIIGALCFLGMSIFRFPYALMISVLVGFTALIPVFGAFIGTAVGALLILMISPLQAVGFVIFIIVLQQLEGNLIYPYVVGSSVGLPGIWVMVAVTIGGSTMGILGMLLSVPVSSLAYHLLRESIHSHLKRKDPAKKQTAVSDKSDS